MTNNEMRNAPRLPRTPRLRNDARTLLRSRYIQAVLAAGTLMQLAVVVDRADERKHAIAAVPSLPAVEAVRTVSSISALRVEEAPQPAAAEDLAAKYRSQGYKISSSLARQIHQAARDQGIDPVIAFGLVRTESGFRNSATSHVGATGLTQLMPATARWLEPGTTRADLRDSGTNLRIGFRYLRDLIRKYDGDTTLALLAYNRGPGTVDRLVKRGRNPDNGYADMVRGLRTTHR